MSDWLVVGIGGFVGSASRHYMGRAVNHWPDAPGFLNSTLVVNLIGCLLIGLLAGVDAGKLLFSPSQKLFLFVGVLGGFTTFSAFGLDTFTMIRGNDWIGAGVNVLVQVVAGLLMVWAGFRAGLMAAH